MVSETLHKVRVTHGEKALGEVSVSVARPERFDRAVLIAHGAGNDMDNALLIELQQGLAGASVAALRFNFLYTEKGRRAPDRRVSLTACWRSVSDWARARLAPEKLVLGGKSMGDRMASYLVAEGYPCDGIFFLGYPLHPSGRPETLRKDHLRDIAAPMLFFSGTRDALCRLELLQPILQEIGSRARLHVIDGGDHSFNVCRSEPGGARRR